MVVVGVKNAVVPVLTNPLGVLITVVTVVIVEGNVEKVKVVGEDDDEELDERDAKAEETDDIEEDDLGKDVVAVGVTIVVVGIGDDEGKDWVGCTEVCGIDVDWMADEVAMEGAC